VEYFRWDGRKDTEMYAGSLEGRERRNNNKILMATESTEEHGKIKPVNIFLKTIMPSRKAMKKYVGEPPL
jgi:hypothetical protein